MIPTPVHLIALPDNKPDIILHCVNTLIAASSKLQTLATQERPVNEEYLRLARKLSFAASEIVKDREVKP